MSHPKVGLVAVASIYESGFDEVDAWLSTAGKNLQNMGLHVVRPGSVILNYSHVKPTIDLLEKEDVDLLLIMNGTWAADSLQIQIINRISKPVLLWALPYPKTFSLASVQHLSSILKNMGIRYSYVYGSPEDDVTIKKIARMAKIAQVVNLWNRMRVGRVGRRFTWRTMGPTDITYDELALELAPGPTPVHIDLEELLAISSKISSDEAQRLIERMKKEGKLGAVEVKEKALIEASKIYFAIKELINKYHLDAITVECYPKYPGLDNLANSWLTEDEITSVCEGDLGHTALALILKKLSNNPVGLLEAVKIEDDDTLILRHDGSGAPSLSDDISQVVLKPISEEGGVTIFSPVKPGLATLATIWGRNENYEVVALKGTVLKLTKRDVERYGGGLVAKVKFEISARELVDRMIEYGSDHHLMLVHGDLVDDLKIFCKFQGMKLITFDPAGFGR